MKLFSPDIKKTVEASLYILNRVPYVTKHKLSKLLYFSDKRHLELYGRSITGNEYVKMEYGPVPSQAYNLMKEEDSEEARELEKGPGHQIKARRKADIEYLSESDIEVLENMIEVHGNKTFGQLKDESHDATWNAGVDNRKFTVDQFLETFEDKDELKDFVENWE